jgi:hypothetical protein
MNPAVQALAWADAAGKTTLTLQNPLPVGWAPPGVGDTIYAYGGAVDIIARGELAMCDALGPSRVGGFADPLAPWPDTLTISGLIRVAEDAIDTDGAKLIAEVLPGGATIDGAALDVQGSDNTVNGPELLFLKAVAITQ